MEWIRELQRKGISIPKKFLTCIKEGSWLKITINDSPGYRPPSESFLLASDGVISMLSFIKFLKQNSRSLNHFVSRIREGRWLKTSHGRRSPVGRVLYNEEWKIARQISKIPFIDEDEYGKEIHSFKPKLQLLGVIIDFGGNYQMVVDNILSSFLSSLTAEVLLFILDCMYHS